MDDLLNTAPCGFLSFADDGTIRLVNVTLLRLLGYESDELTGQHVETLFTVASRIFYQTHFFPLLRMHGRAEEIYLALRSREGGNVPVLVNAVRKERDGVTVNDCVVVQMWQRRKYEDEIVEAKRTAEEAVRTKSKFLSMMSHELRTPLNAVSGYADILTMGIRGQLTEPQLEDLRRIKNASQYLLGLINDLLNFARLESGQVNFKLQRLPVDVALSEAENLVMLRVHESGLRYTRTGCGPELTVRADPERLQQILLNLLTNAIKFTERDGTIGVSCETRDGRTLIHVSDTGRGIPADALERIFDPFVQVDRHRNERSQQGVGLGLAISRDLARAMHGDITARSVAGEGSTFTLTLPTG